MFVQCSPSSINVQGHKAPARFLALMLGAKVQRVWSSGLWELDSLVRFGLAHSWWKFAPPSCVSLLLCPRSPWRIWCGCPLARGPSRKAVALSVHRRRERERDWGTIPASGRCKLLNNAGQCSVCEREKETEREIGGRERTRASERNRAKKRQQKQVMKVCCSLYDKVEIFTKSNTHLSCYIYPGQDEFIKNASSDLVQQLGKSHDASGLRRAIV